MLCLFCFVTKIEVHKSKYTKIIFELIYCLFYSHTITSLKSAVGPLCLKHAGVHAPPLVQVLYIGKSKKIQPNLKVNYIQNENEDIAGMSR